MFIFQLARAGAGGGSGFLQLPPLHPILVNFTAALVPASLISDVLGRLFRKQSLLSAGWWMLLYAAVITPFTALAGWWWLRQMGGMDVPEMAIHKWLGTALAVVFVALVFWRWHIHRSASAPGWLYLICAAAVVSLLTLQGHLGGSMSFASNQDMSNSAPGNPAHLSSSGRTGEGGLQWRDHINLKDDR